MSVDRAEFAVSGPVMGRGRTVFLLATVFASGAAVMTVEMTAARALQPFFGSTTYVWTNVIAVVLAALSVGYALGGRLADRRPSAVILYALLSGGGLLLVLCGWLVTPVSRMFLTEGLNLEGVVTVLTRGSLGATLILFAPPIALLGMISPIAIRLLAAGGVGRAAGRVFAISTLGSILGTYLPTFFLVRWFGSRGSILAAAAILGVFGAAGLIVFGRSRRARAAAATILLLLGGRIAMAAALDDIRPERGAPPLWFGGRATVLRETESEYQYLTVRRDEYPDRPAQVILTINEGVYTYHSLRVSGSVLTDSRYYDDYSALPFLLDLEPGAELRAGVVGLACGINAAQWKHFWDGPYRLRVDGAELDPEVVALGREFFDLPGPESDWLRVHEMDGRQMLVCLPEDRRYHMLVVDAFANELYIPFHLATREFFDLCRERLEPGGILAMNVYAAGRNPPNLGAIANTLATSFGRCVRVQQYVEGNYLLLATKGDRPPDPARLGRMAIRDRFGRWDGFAAWSRIPEWESLADLADRLRLRKWPRSGGPKWVDVEPDPDEILLTDDRAPLEWLTDRFLDREERKALDPVAARPDQLERRDGLLRLRDRQDGLLTKAVVAWLAALLVAGFVVYRLRPARSS